MSSASISEREERTAAAAMTTMMMTREELEWLLQRLRSACESAHAQYLLHLPRMGIPKPKRFVIPEGGRSFAIGAHLEPLANVISCSCQGPWIY